MAALRERRSSAGGSTTLPALLMVFLLIIGVLIPSSFLLIALAQQIPKGISVIREWIASGFTIPPAISEIPGIGPWLHDQLLFAIDPASLSTTMQKLLEPLSAALLNAAVNVSNILLQLALVTFIVFFFYRDGAWFADRVQALMKRCLGRPLERTHEDPRQHDPFRRLRPRGHRARPGRRRRHRLLDRRRAWHPHALAHSSSSSRSSRSDLPSSGARPPSGSTRRAKRAWPSSSSSGGSSPSRAWTTSSSRSSSRRGSSLPLALIFLGVFGGVIAFGFLGLILGPILLAVGLSMLQAWLKNPILAAKLDPDRPRRSRRPIKREKRESTQTKGNSLDNPSDQENTSE